MILVDTSVWIDHLRHGNRRLVSLLNAGVVLIHPFIVGEIALGHLRHRASLLNELGNLQQASAATDEEVMHFIERQALYGTGIGYVDAHLLAATTLTSGTKFWSFDRRVHQVALRLGLGHTGA